MVLSNSLYTLSLEYDMIGQEKQGIIFLLGKKKILRQGRFYGQQPDQGENIKRKLGHV